MVSRQNMSLGALSVVIPARNEEDCIEGTVAELANTLSNAKIP